jgi:hypothetical protein
VYTITRNSQDFLYLLHLIGMFSVLNTPYSPWTLRMFFFAAAIVLEPSAGSKNYRYDTRFCVFLSPALGSAEPLSWGGGGGSVPASSCCSIDFTHKEPEEQPEPNRARTACHDKAALRLLRCSVLKSFSHVCVRYLTFLIYLIGPLCEARKFLLFFTAMAPRQGAPGAGNSHKNEKLSGLARPLWAGAVHAVHRALCWPPCSLRHKCEMAAL